MAEKKKVVAKRVSDRKAFVGSRGSEKDSASRQRFYVETRVAEMQAKGKTVTPAIRKQLRNNFQSGAVAREGFGAPKKKASGPRTVGRTDSGGRGGFGATAPKVRSTGANAAAGSRARASSSRTDSAGRSGFGSTKSKAPTRNQIEGRGGPGKGRPATSNMRGIAGFGRTDSAGRSGFGAARPKPAVGRRMGKRIAGFGRTDSSGRSGFGSTRPKPAVGRRPEDMRRRIAPRPEDSMRGLFPSLPRRPKPKVTGQLRTDLRDMYPKKKRTPVKPRGNPNKQYMIKPAKY